MNVELYHKLVFERIAKGHRVVQRKACKKKGIEGEVFYVPGVVTKQLVGETMQNRISATMLELELELGKMRKAGLIHFTNGICWRRDAKASKAG